MAPDLKTLIAYILGLIILSTCVDKNAERTDSATMRIMSYNIKFDDKADTVNGWDQRKEQVVNLISFYRPDFIGTQEGLLHQLRFMNSRLENMDWIGAGRTDGKLEGEFSALFYNNDRFKLIAGTDSTLWLSETPSKPTKSWDAALPRILTWGKFRSKDANKEFYVFNTHFDHIGDTARAKSAELIVQTIQKVAGDFPVMLTGDFNATEDSRPYEILANNLSDTFYSSTLPHVGPEFSFEGFETLSSNDKRRIDYIFVNDKLKVNTHAIISDFRDGRYPSDHLPVIADVSLN